jgi:hypothetical protein
MKRPTFARALLRGGFAAIGIWPGVADQGLLATSQVWALPLVLLAGFFALGRALTKDLYRRA